MSQFTSRDVMVTVLPDEVIGEISWDGIQACTAGSTKGTCTTCTNRTNSTGKPKPKPFARDFAIIKAQLRSRR